MHHKELKVIFFGTGEFAVTPLEYLAKSTELLTVVTQPDRPGGRKMQHQASPVKQKAVELNIPVLQPEKIKKNTDLHDLIKKLNPDFLVVVSYGNIIPKEILDVPKYMPVNIHPSLLPQYRGATPIQQSLLKGDKETGVTFIRMDEGIDTGDILHVKKIQIEDEDNFAGLSYKLAHLSGLLLSGLLEEISENIITPLPQDNSKASLCGKIEKEEGKISWFKESAQEIENKVKALTPWPGTFSFIENKRVKILKARAINIENRLKPGQTHQTSKTGFVVGTKQGELEVLELQMEGKKPVTSEEFLRGRQTEINFQEE